MFTKTRILLSLMILMVCSAASAQEQIERLFRSDRQNTGIDVAQTSDNGYLVLSGGRHLDSTRFDYLNVTKFDNKTNLLWSMDYSFEHKIFPDGSITLLEQDSFIITGVLDTTSINKVLLKADPSGAVVWTRGYGRDDTDTPSLLGDAVTDMTYRNGFFVAGDVYGPGISTDIFLAESDGDGNQLWAKSYSGTSNGFLTSKVQMTQDSGAIICGSNITFPDSDIFLVKTDSLGNVEWSRNYGESTLAEIGTTVVPTPDGGYLVGGRKINPILPSHPGILIKTDTFGTPQWVLNVDFQTSDSILINDIIIAGDGTAVVSGSLLGADDNFAFMMKVNLSGDIIWKRRYKASTRQFTFSNGLIESTMAGYVYLTTSDEDEGMGPVQAGPYLIKTDADGTTICDSIVDGQLVFPTTITLDTLILTTTDINDTKAINVVDTLIYGGFNLVPLELESFGPYCPEAVFNDTLDATTDGAIAYEWSTGETTPTIIVSEFDEYMVTVTVGEDYCYQLCASSTISPLPLPMVELSIDDSNFCETGTVSVNAGLSAVDEISWSNGEMNTNSITVDTEGLYSVTVSNNCDTIFADITVTFDTSPPSVDVDGDGTFCATGTDDISATFPFGNPMWSTGESTASITATATGTYSITVSSNFCEDGLGSYVVEDTPLSGSIDGDGSLCQDGEELLVVTSSSDAVNYAWQDGETTSSIAVNNSGTFSVVVSDFCDDLPLEFTVVENSTITATIQRDDTFCQEDTEELSLAETGASYVWSTGATTPTTIATIEGTYSVTITDFCGETATDEVLITCPILYDIGNAFTPNNDAVSEVFIPVFEFNPTQLVEYEFVVYSRWGKKVFETTNPVEGWDGMVGDKPGISDVYFFTVKGVNDLGVQLTNVDVSKENHGDVTLIR